LKVTYDFYGTAVWITKAGSNFNYVNQNIPFKEWGASPIWKGETLRLHSPSEHTIGGTRYDMEVNVQMSRVVNIGDMYYSFTSFMFSVNSPTALFCTKECVQAIDNFFDDLTLENVWNPWVDQVRFADAFLYMDTDNRFAYKGSNTIPPCAANWMRDVCMTIYPIKQKHVDQYRKFQLSRNPTTKMDLPYVDGVGGIQRATQPTIPAHKVMVVTNEYSAMVLVLIVVAAVFICLCLICCICCCRYCCKYKNAKGTTAPIDAKKGAAGAKGKASPAKPAGKAPPKKK